MSLKRTYETLTFDENTLKLNLELNGWKTFLDEEFKSPNTFKIAKSIRDDIARFKDDQINIYPPIDLIFNAFIKTPLEKIKVVIVGMDPYIHDGQAMGLSFSVPDGVKIPPSLLNIYKELERDYPTFKRPESGDLTKWAEQGVFLLNAVLTVREGKSDSHSGFGWEEFTQRALSHLYKESDGVVWLVWGNNAKKVCDKVINNNPATNTLPKNHLVLYAGHPSPLNRSNPFIGCGHFSKANEWLIRHNKEPIKW